MTGDINTDFIKPWFCSENVTFLEYGIISIM